MKIYTEMQVATATFLGSPVAGGILMAHNARAIGQEKEKRKYLLVTAIASIALLVVAFYLPERKPGNYLIPLVASWAMRLWYQKAQGGLMTSGRFPEATKASWWLALGISLLVAIAILALLVGFVLLFPGFVGADT